jgi:small GTP-binding protein
MEYICKIIIIGNSGVGKSSLCENYITNTFNNTEYNPTIGLEFYSKIITVDNKIIHLQIWDTAGQERFRCITTQYYRDANGIIICFSLDDPKSFQELEIHMKDLQYHTHKESHENTIKKILVGTFSDIDTYKISNEEINLFANEYNLKYYNVSSKTGENVFNSFNELIQNINNDNLKIYNQTNISNNNNNNNNDFFYCCIIN